MPISWDHIVPIVRMAEILAKLGHTNDVSSRLVFEADEKDTPDGVAGPDESKRKLADRLDLSQVMLVLVSDLCQSRLELSVLLNVLGGELLRGLLSSSHGSRLADNMCRSVTMLFGE